MSQSQPGGNKNLTVAYKFYEGRLRVGIPYRLFKDLARLSGSRTYREAAEPPVDPKVTEDDRNKNDNNPAKLVSNPEILSEENN